MKNLLKVEKVAELLNVSISQVYALMNQGKLRAYRLTTKKNGGVRFSERQIEEYLAASETRPEDEGDLRYL